MAVVKTHGVGTTQMDIAAGDDLPTYLAMGETKLECSHGRVRVCMQNHAEELSTGAALTVAPRVAHRIDVIEDAQLLITVQPVLHPQETKYDVVDEASIESFPASDAPAWTSITRT